MINKISKYQSSTTCSWATNYNPQVSGEFQLEALEEPRIWRSHSTTDLKRICSSSFFLYIITLCWHDAIAQNKTNKSRLQSHCTRGFPAYIDWLPLSPFYFRGVHDWPHFKMQLTTQPPSFPLSMHKAATSDHQRAVASSRLGPAPFHAQEKDALAHHRGMVSLRISDGKLVNHTAEMILWSMILTQICLSCPYKESKFSISLGERSRQIFKCFFYTHRDVATADVSWMPGSLFQYAMSKIFLYRDGDNVAPSVGNLTMCQCVRLTACNVQKLRNRFLFFWQWAVPCVWTSLDKKENNFDFDWNGL